MSAPDDAVIDLMLDAYWATVGPVPHTDMQRTDMRAALAAAEGVGYVLSVVPIARPIAEWHEDMGPAFWWSFPIEEAPYAGSPLDDGWPGYHTHWTPIIVPRGP